MSTQSAAADAPLIPTTPTPTDAERIGKLEAEMRIHARRLDAVEADVERALAQDEHTDSRLDAKANVTKRLIARVDGHDVDIARLKAVDARTLNEVQRATRVTLDSVHEFDGIVGGIKSNLAEIEGARERGADVTIDMFAKFAAHLNERRRKDDRRRDAAMLFLGTIIVGVGAYVSHGLNTHDAIEARVEAATRSTAHAAASSDAGVPR